MVVVTSAAETASAVQVEDSAKDKETLRRYERGGLGGQKIDCASDARGNGGMRSLADAGELSKVSALFPVTSVAPGVWLLSIER